MKRLRNVTIPFKMYHAIWPMQVEKAAIRRARQAGDFDAECAAICRATTNWSKEMIDSFHLKLVISGQENIPKTGPVVIVCNHQGYADIPAVMWAIQDLPLCFVAKSMMRNLPFYGNWIKKWQRGVFMDRKSTRASVQSLYEAMDLLKAGYSMVIFPEGHRSRSDTPGAFHPGSFRLATKTGTPILPVSLSGAFHVFEEPGYPRPAEVRVTIHPLRQTASLNRTEVGPMAKEVEDTICSVL